MDTQHTPGPWKTIPSPHGRDYRCVQLGKDDMYTTLELLPADAQLIAAAPDLLAALRDLDEAVRCFYRDNNLDGMFTETVDAALDSARAAIAKV